MLKTNKQLNNTKELLKRVIETRDSFEKNTISDEIQIVYSNRLIINLENQISEYENLQKDVVKIESKEITRFSDILIMARIAKGLTQKQLAERLGIAEQQIQRYEASDYSGATFGKMVDVALALELDLRFEAFEIVKTNFSSSKLDKIPTKSKIKKKHHASVQ